MKTWQSITRALAPAFTLLSVLATNPVTAQSSYPDKPVNILIPFAAGGAMDALARPLGDAYAQATGQSWIIENLGGAAGTIATARAVRAPADGYHVLMASNGQVSIAPFVYPALPYDPAKDLLPIVHLADNTAVLYTSMDSPYQTVADVVKASQTTPDGISFAHAGNGSVSHLAMALLEQQSGARFVAIPYKGSGSAINDLAAGRVPLLFTHVSTAASMVAAGRVRPLAVASVQRLASLPEVPTIAEAGVPGVIVKLWVGLMTPADTPQTSIEALARQVNEILQQPAMRARLAAQGWEIAGGTAQQFGDMILRDTDQWRTLASSVNLSGQ